MHLKKIKKSKFQINSHKQLLLSSIITIGILCPSKLISKPLVNPSFNKINTISNKSFISKAVEKTGSSVVTIDTQRFVKKENFQEILNFL